MKTPLRNLWDFFSKPYLVDSTPGLFNAHRLPLQTGSYLLNADYQPIWTTQERCVEQWQFTQLRNDLDPLELKRILRDLQENKTPCLTHCRPLSKTLAD